MNKKLLSLSMLLVLLLLGSSQTASSVNVPIPHKGHYIIEEIGDPEYIDPAWAYDSFSGDLITNLYDPLIRFDREKTDEFVPALSNNVPAVINGTIVFGNWDVTLTDGVDPETGLYDPDHDHGSGQSQYVTYVEKLIFNITVGVPFHTGDSLTMDDVEYSFERWMLTDRSGGSSWMIIEPVMGIGVYHVDPSDPVQDEVIDSAFRVNSTGIFGANTFEIWLTVRYGPILSVLAQYWASIVNKSFMIKNGEWDGKWQNWANWHNHPGGLGDREDGTGPFALGYDFGNGIGYWTVGVEWSIVRFPSYWGGWPYEQASRYLDRVTHKVVYEWSTRLADFRVGSADTVYVPKSYIAQVEGWPGIRGLKDLPTLSADAMFFNLDIDPASPYVGTGQFPNGIPLNFFNDVRIRKAFACVFNYTSYSTTQPADPVIAGVHYDNLMNEKPIFNLTRAAELFQNASDDPTSPAYQVWTLGFYFKIPYVMGNLPRQIVAEMLRTNVKLVNPLFRIDIIGVPWSDYLSEVWWFPTFRSIIPLFMESATDGSDPHNWVMPFMHTLGSFAFPSSYSHPVVDALIEAGIATPDDWVPYADELDAPNPIPLMNNLPNGNPDWRTWPTYSSYYRDNPLDNRWPRRSIYYALQRIYFEDAPGVMLAQTTICRWERDWVQGWYHNPLLGDGVHGPYYYHLWEGLNGDIDGDNDVDAVDWALIVSVYWWDPPEHGTYGAYNAKADVAPPLMYIEGMLPPPGTSVGLVDTLDLAMLNAHWLEADP